MPDRVDEPAEAQGGDLHLQMLRERAGRRSPFAAVGVLSDAARLVWRTSHREVVVVGVFQFLAATITAGQVLAARSGLQTVLARSDGRQVQDALPALALLAGLTSASTLIAAIQAQRMSYLGELVGRKVGNQLLEVTTGVELATFDDGTFHEQLERVQANAMQQPLVVVQALVGIASGLLGVTGLLAALLIVQPVLVMVVLLAGVPLFFLQRRGGKLEYAFALEWTPNLRRRILLRQMLIERRSAAEIRSFAAAPLLRGRYDELYDAYLAGLRRKVGKRIRLALLSTLAATLVAVTAIGLLLAFVHSGRIGLAAAGAAAAAIALLSSRLQQLLGGAGQLLQARLFLEDLRHFLDIVPQELDPPELNVEPLGFETLTLRDVGFTYAQAPSPALAGVCLEIRRGESIAIVGENGSGKTTLSKLLAHLYEPSTGSICWDDADTRDLPRERLRAGTAVLFQDFVHYELTAGENIRIGRPEAFADLERMAEAARAAGADGLVGRLPAGYDTVLSALLPGGRELSGGQWQRVAIARALFRDAPFVVLDEPTAALDPRAEAALFERLTHLLRGRTSVLVSHRFSSVRTADKIVVMHEGRIVENGSHHELMTLGGHYKEMFTLQAKAYLSASAPVAGPDDNVA